MESFTFHTQAGNTAILFAGASGNLYVPEFPAAGGIYVADANTAPLLRQAAGFSAQAPLVVLPAGEQEKTLDTVSGILSAALQAGLGRDSLFIGFGGGVITDMTAFAASVYMRGARLQLVPTTLLAMVDAAVGGKTGVDFGPYKNSVGSFFPAEKILIFPAALRTLPETEFRSGLAEMLKTAMLYDETLFRFFTERRAELQARDAALLAEAVRRCAQAKAAVVEKDLYEKGERAFLNLGHTFGHALEAAAGFGTVTHGEAVAWGIGRALALGGRLGLTDPHYREEVFHLLSAFGWSTAPVHPALHHEANPGEKLLAAMRGDKKRKNGALRFVLQSRLCNTQICGADDRDILAVLA